MKIAIFTDTFYPQVNGVSNFAFFCAKSLAERNHQVEVFTVISRGDLGVSDFKSNNFKVYPIPSLPAPIYRGQGLRMSLPVGFSLRELKKFKPDIIHVHTPFAVGWEAVMGAKLFKIPLIGEHHTFYDHYLKHIHFEYGWTKHFSWKITTGYYNRCDLVVSPSKSLADSLVDSGLKKPVRVIPNSIDTELFSPISEEEKIKYKKKYGINGLSIVYMGRISYEKSIDKVILSFEKILKKDEFKDTKLVIIGDGPEKDNLKALAKKLNIEKNIIWTGVLRNEELAKTMACNDVFITASKSENMPLSVLEAMACGLPVIAVSENGLQEIIKDNYNGYLCKADDTDEMAEKIGNLLENVNRQKQFSVASRKLAMNYSKDKIMELFEDCYRATINKFKQQ
jgi:1,2-diacylglycerol 3-alpha-glucosyltransferase